MFLPVNNLPKCAQVRSKYETEEEVCPRLQQDESDETDYTSFTYISR